MSTASLRKWLRSCCVAALAGLALLPAMAQYTSDIDIYSANTGTGDAPNVLIILDNTANWNSAFTNEIAALVSTFDALPATKSFRVGLMLFTESGSGNTGNDGGYVRAAIRLTDADYKTKLKALLNSLDKNADKSNGGKAGQTLAEAYYYFSAGTPDTGNNKAKTDYTGNTSGSTASNAIYALAGNALAAKGASSYSNPVTSSCQRNYIIYISNGTPSDNSSDNSAASTKLTAAYTAAGLTRPADITLTGVGSPLSGNVADEWARLMNVSALNINTFTLDVDKVSTGQGPSWTKLLKSMALVGGGQYYDVSSSNNAGADIAAAMGDIFNKIQAVDSVFASASLPVSVNARGTYLNQIFMGMFRPDGDANPRWKGNLKQYQFGYDIETDSVFLADAAGKAAVTSTKGFFDPTAISFWTQASTFWANDPIGSPPSSSDSPDGDVVEKGGIAQGLRTTYATAQTARKVYTCKSCTSGALTAFDTTNIAAADLGLSSSSARDDLVNWVRGTDNAGDELGPGGTTTVRPSVHGDVLHSRPAVVSYGGSRGVVVFYGANDGMLHAINGNQSGSGAGQELWSFIPEEHLTKLNRLRSNTPSIRLSTTTIPATNPPTPRDYFVDGPIGVYQKASVSGSTQTNDKVYIYVGMRRGGRALYALDVTDPTAPTVLWKKTQANLAVLGQTWSEPKLAKIKGNSNPVLIFGAGYDATAEDVSPPAASTTMGNAVLVLDAFTGSVLKSFATSRSVPSDVALVDSDFDGYVDRVYAVDLGGNVYRVDLESATGDGSCTSLSCNWGISTFAALSETGKLRKFFFPPDVVVTSGYTAVLVGSGDREKPLASSSNDMFFTLKDTRTTKGTPSGTAIARGDLGQVGSSDATASGCYISLSTAGEKVVNAATTAGGITYFSTNMPDSGGAAACSSSLGIAKTYAAPLFCATATSQKLNSSGLPPSPVAGIVTVSYYNPKTHANETKEVPFIIGAPNSKGSGIEGTKVNPAIAPVRTKRYWYLNNAR
ncbi:MAG: pilus assembly protein PilY [Rhodoferax sp.]|nr:pilus assembly protein PilY [Rhodoferax sp.]